MRISLWKGDDVPAGHSVRSRTWHISFFDLSHLVPADLKSQHYLPLLKDYSPGTLIALP